MEPIGIALVCAFTLCIFLFAVRSVCLRVTRSKMLEDALPFTVYATIRRADDAEYIVRSVLERVKWLDLYGMCPIPKQFIPVRGKPIIIHTLELFQNDPEIDAIIRRLVQKYPFAEIGAFQTRKNVL